LKTFDTVIAETPAFRATSLIVTLAVCRGRLARCMVVGSGGLGAARERRSERGLWFNDKPNNPAMRLIISEACP
jgi:hypothetical protein